MASVVGVVLRMVGIEARFPRRFVDLGAQTRRVGASPNPPAVDERSAGMECTFSPIRQRYGRTAHVNAETRHSVPPAQPTEQLTVISD